MALKHIRSIHIVGLFLLVFFQVSAWGQGGYEVYEISFKGQDSLSREVLLNRMNTREATLYEKLAFWKEGPPFSVIMFENDLQRLRQFHQRHGFLDPRLDYRLRKDDRNKRLRIEIDIDEGEPVT